MSLAENPESSYAEQALQKYGYQQEFRRELKRFASFAIGFCYHSHTRKCANTTERSVLPASSSIASAREPLDRRSRFGLTSTPQAFYVRR